MLSHPLPVSDRPVHAVAVHGRVVAGYVLTRAEITELAAESAEDPELVTS